MPAHVGTALAVVGESFCVEHKEAGFGVKIAWLTEHYRLVVLGHDCHEKRVRVVQVLGVRVTEIARKNSWLSHRKASVSQKVVHQAQGQLCDAKPLTLN